MSGSSPRSLPLPVNQYVATFTHLTKKTVSRGFHTAALTAPVCGHRSPSVTNAACGLGFAGDENQSSVS